MTRSDAPETTRVASDTVARQADDAALAGVLERITDAFFAVDTAWRFTYVNARAEELLEREREHLLGRVVWEEFPDAVGSPFHTEYTRAMADGTTKRFTAYYSPLARWFEVHAYPSEDGLSVFFRDVSDLRAREQRYRALFEHGPALKFLVCKNGRVDALNRTATRALLVDAGSVLGDSVYDFFDPEDAEDAREHIARAFDARGEDEGDEWEARIVRADGARRWVRFATRHMPAAGPRDVVLVHGVDVTDRHRTEAELRETKAQLERRVNERTRELEAALEELDSFNYSVAHDLRAPLRGIEFFSGILEEEASEQLTREQRGYLERLRGEAQRLSTLVSRLHTLARAARETIEREDVDVTALAEDVVNDFRMNEPEREVDVHVQDGLHTLADPRLLRVVLENLIGNAWKYTSRTRRARIEVGREDGDGESFFFVKDNGAGFDPAKTDRLFTPFQRLHGHRDFEGTGVGLATVARIVGRHGGRVFAKGEEGKGATFYFRME